MDAPRPADAAAALAAEQAHLDRLYDRLDALRAAAGQRLREALRETGGTPATRAERESRVAAHRADEARLAAVEEGLCFGRLDTTDGGRTYIGRIGLRAEDPEAPPLLVDWRAPAARPFYLATAAAPEGVRRRRHLRTSGRTLRGVDDEVLDLDEARHGRGADVTGEAALLAAVAAPRSGRMRDIVATIQAEQDRIIRAPLAGTLVVQGGPGTGKTAVALHRAAYLLYTHRRELTSRAVLIVGPNTTFLRYIAHVLPSLAETGVVLQTPGDLYPGVSARRPERPEVAAVKGDRAMAAVLAAAVADRQVVPAGPVEVPAEDGPLTLEPATVAAARERVRRTGRPHNLARPLFDIEVVHALADQVAARIGADPLGGDNLLTAGDLADLRGELRRDPGLRAELDALWPVLTPEELVADLLGDRDRLAAAAGSLPAAQRELLYRADGAAFTAADAPLLDEAAELLGVDDRAAARAAARARRRAESYAEGALDIVRGSASIDVEDEDDPEILAATDLLDAAQLAARHVDADARTAAERAAADREWAYGHVIVDEAQELSEMDWRVLMRRCPSRSMTIVGDTAQTGRHGGAASWSDVLAPYLADRWRLAELTVSYRTPAEILDVAGGVLARIDPALSPPAAVRSAGVAPRAYRVAEESLAQEAARRAGAELAALGAGTVAVVLPDDRYAALAPAVRQAGAAAGDRLAVWTVGRAKGLECDAVVLVEPAALVAGSPRGWQDLYVALTRATARLSVVHAAALPTPLAGLAAG
ncbi:DNA helicase [Pilimelia terevasa]|uniref:DNA helicase n=1 Tax=Pilimelia terevasa TaxID=53372 RepID=A0A8J3FM49_9ACTN|nr:UvrD-helicase domain-containing protein [Pilimelia terevasa]GGK43928.1 DNA helicase [Pilimelia terevasa]